MQWRGNTRSLRNVTQLASWLQRAGNKPCPWLTLPAVAHFWTRGQTQHQGPSAFQRHGDKQALWESSQPLPHPGAPLSLAQTLRKSSPPLKLSYLFPKGAVFLADIPDDTWISLLAWLLDVLSQMSFLSCFLSVFVAAQWTKLYSLTSPSHGCEVMSAMSSPTLQNSHQLLSFRIMAIRRSHLLLLIHSTGVYCAITVYNSSKRRHMQNFKISIKHMKKNLAKLSSICFTWLI